MATLDHQHKVAASREIRRNEMHIDAETLCQHAARIADAAGAVDIEADRQPMQQHTALLG